MNPNEVVAIFRTTVRDHYLDMAGRVGRREFWLFALGWFVVILGAGFLGRILQIEAIGTLVNLALLLPIAGMCARRIQDTGNDGKLVWIWVAIAAFYSFLSLLTLLKGPLILLTALFFLFSVTHLVSLILFVLTVILFAFCAQPGMPSKNPYGPPPQIQPAPKA